MTQAPKKRYAPLSNGLCYGVGFDEEIGPWRCLSFVPEEDFSVDFLETHISHEGDGVVFRVTTARDVDENTSDVTLGRCAILTPEDALRVASLLQQLAAEALENRKKKEDADKRRND